MSNEKFNFNSNYLTKILKTNFTSPNGQPTPVFVKNKDRHGLYDCVLCSAHQMNPHNLIQHSRGRRHSQNLSYVDASSDECQTTNKEDLRALDRDTVEQLPTGHTSVEPTRCVPSCAESERSDRCRSKVSQLQTTIDEIEDIPVIGLEHMLDVQLNGESSYLCVLCEKVFDPISDAVEHLTSSRHRLLYLQKFFPKIFDDITSFIEMVCEGIEKKYNRSKLIVLEKSEFLENKEKFIRLSSTEYINDKIGCADLISCAGTDVAAHDTAVCDEVISVSSDTSSDDTTLNQNSIKLATFWSQTVAAKNELLKTYQLYITNPSSYPGYSQMWVSFWNSRIADLQHSDKLNSYDWTAEWATEWRKIMNEKLKADMEVKCSRIKKNLGITDDMLGDREKSLIHPPNVAVDAAKPEMPPEKSTSPIERKPRIKSPFSQQTVQQHSVANSTDSTTNQQKKLTLNKSRTPLRLDQLLEKHNHSDDFLISWRELLEIFGIDDGDNSNEIDAMPPQICQEPDEPSKEQLDVVVDASIEKQPIENVEPVTVFSVLRTLVALENLLGSLAPKIIDLLQTAIAMEGLKAGSSSALLNSSNYCILFETVSEKFKGLLMGDLVAANLQKNIRKAIDDMTTLLQSAERTKTCYVLPTFKKTAPHAQTFLSIESSNNTGVLASLSQSIMNAQLQSPMPIENPKSCYKPPALNHMEKTAPKQPPPAIESPERCLVAPSFNQIVDRSLPQREISSSPTIVDSDDEAVSLKDAEIKTLMIKFSYLSARDKNNFVGFLNKLRITDPNRLMRLKNEICANQVLTQQSVLEWEKEMNYPAGSAYYDDYMENTFEAGESDRMMSLAYKVAQKNASVKIKRKTPNHESGDFFEGKRFYQG